MLKRAFAILLALLLVIMPTPAQEESMSASNSRAIASNLSYAKSLF